MGFKKESKDILYQLNNVFTLGDTHPTCVMSIYTTLLSITVLRYICNLFTKFIIIICIRALGLL